MVKTKYTFEKRQREIARQKKREEKAAKKAEAKRERAHSGEEASTPDVAEAEPQTPENH